MEVLFVHKENTMTIQSKIDNRLNEMQVRVPKNRKAFKTLRNSFDYLKDLPEKELHRLYSSIFMYGYEEGYDEAYEKGEEDGWDGGHRNGYDKGYDAGMNDGHAEGWNKGYDEARVDRKKSKNKDYQRGYKEGYAECEIDNANTRFDN